MCGIAGWLSFEEDVREKRDALEAMSGTLANRGPDGRGMYITPSAGLAHRRLAVVDIAGGRQPMRTPQVSAWLVMLGVWMERFHVELV